ncbi:MAG: MBL fold metallo-hydrolase [Acidobacteria bacterium]|nr:MBL fold metallo-hydrolase [Acidobacteriota bacterium]
MRPVSCLVLLAWAGAPALGVVVAAQENGTAAAADVRVLQVRDGIYMVAGAGGNVTVQVGGDGILLVDTGRAAMGDQVLAAIRTISNAPIRQIVLTHDHPDSAGGVATLRTAGDAVLGGNFGGRAGAAILAHENAWLRMSAGGLPPAALPTDTYHVRRHDFSFNGEPVEILHQPRAHTDGDSMVLFRRSDVISTGDIFSTTRYPVIDVASGGSINGVIDALNRLLEITIPRTLQEDGTLVIPGDGRLCDEGDVNWYRYMVTVIRDRVQDMATRGMTLEQVKAARPTLEYDGRYGSETGPWTTEMFIEAVYRGVSAPQSR